MGDVVVQNHHFVSVTLMLGAQYAGHSIDVKGITYMKIRYILQ